MYFLYSAQNVFTPLSFSIVSSNFIEWDDDKIITFSKKALYELSKMLNGINLYYDKLQSKLDAINISNSDIIPSSQYLWKTYQEDKNDTSQKKEKSKRMWFLKKIWNLFRKKR